MSEIFIVRHTPEVDQAELDRVNELLTMQSRLDAIAPDSELSLAEALGRGPLDIAMTIDGVASRMEVNRRREDGMLFGSLDSDDDPNCVYVPDPRFPEDLLETNCAGLLVFGDKPILEVHFVDAKHDAEISDMNSYFVSNS